MYHRFLANDLPVQLEHVPLHQQRMWFMHDGAPPHFLCTVRQHLNQTSGERWTGRGGPVKWPARSDDLNPLNVWLWGHLYSLVYSAPIIELEVLQQGVQSACQEIRVIPGMHASGRRRAESCASGVVITRTSPISQQPLVSGQVDWDFFCSCEYYNPLKPITPFLNILYLQ
jgi:hypothetical protein